MVITSSTRNRVAFTGTWVRIPPPPPFCDKSEPFRNETGSDLFILRLQLPLGAFRLLEKLCFYGKKSRQRFVYIMAGAMKNKMVMRIMTVLMMALLAACSNEATDSETAVTVMDMEMTSTYDETDPFVSEQRFYVSEDVESADFEASLQMTSETCLLEIADYETNELMITCFWRDGFNHSGTDKEYITLVDLEKDKEYVIRLTCTEVEYVKLIVTSDSRFVQKTQQP